MHSFDVAVRKKMPVESKSVKMESVVFDQPCNTFKTPKKDELLEEYLKVLNKKDEQLQELLRVVEQHRVDNSENEEALEQRLQNVEAELRAKRKTISKLKRAHFEDMKVISQLSLIVDQLKSRLTGAQDQSQKHGTEAVLSQKDIQVTQPAASDDVAADICKNEWMHPFNCAKQSDLCSLPSDHFRIQKMHYESIRRENAFLKADVETHTRDCLEMELKLKNAERQLEEMQARENELLSLRKLNTALELQLATCTAKHESTLERCQNYKSEIDSLQNERLQMTKLQEELTFTRREGEAALKALKQEYLMKFQAMETSQAMELTRIKRGFEEELSIYSIRLKSAEKELAEKSLQLTQQTASRATIADEELRRLITLNENELLKLRAEREASSERITFERERFREEVTKNDKLQLQCDKLLRELESVRLDNGVFEDRLQQHRNERIKLEEDIRNNHFASEKLHQKDLLINDLQHQLEDTKRKGEEMKRTISVTEMQLSECRETHKEALKEMQVETTTLMSELQACRAVNQADELLKRELQGKIDILESQVGQLRDECKAVQLRAEEVEQEARNAVQHFSVIDAKSGLSGEANHRAKLDSGASGSISQESSATLDHLQQEITEMRSRYAESQSNYKRLESVVAQLEENNRLNRDQQSLTLENYQHQIQQLEDSLNSRNEKYKALKKEFKETLEILEKKEEMIAEAQREAEHQASLTQGIRIQYKREKGKMDRLLQHYEDKAIHSSDEERASRSREAALLAELERCEASLRERDQCARRSTECVQNQSRMTPPFQSTQNVNAETMETLRATREELEWVKENYNKQLQLIIESYYEMACFTKKNLGDAFLQSMYGTGNGSLRRMENALREVLQASSTANCTLIEKLSLQKIEFEHDLKRERFNYESALEKLETEWQRKIEHAVQAADSQFRSRSRDLTDQMELLRSERDSLQRKLQEMLSSQQVLLAAKENLEVENLYQRDQLSDLQRQLSESEKRWLSVRREGEETARGTRIELNNLRTKLEDTELEYRHTEDELRELKAELASMKQSCSEKESELQREKQRIRVVSLRANEATSERDTMKNELQQLQSQVMSLTAQLGKAKDSAQRHSFQLKDIEARQETQLIDLRALLAAANEEKQKLERNLKLNHQEHEKLLDELASARRAAAELNDNLVGKGSELSLLRERCANAESLKHIVETSLGESEQREKHLKEQLDELRRSHQIMQACFDKQQEQIKSSRKRIIKDDEIQFNTVV